ncbi:MAG TPA: efflux RND transporter periplasmic adaptor subunit [Chthoniobacterales bacterium]|nr:efflux RND transporter periplasmic adaptor subunit [Chthoniobacterales bacterium]
MNTNLLSPRSPSSAPVTSAVPQRRNLRGAVFKVVIGLVAVFLLIAGIKVWQIMTLVAAGKKMVPPPTTVTSSPVQKGDWQPTLTAVGSINAVQGAIISAELAGTVIEINFQSGTTVKKGDVLIKLDASAEQAQLRSAQADAELAKADFERAKDLANRKVISAAELDAASSKYTQKQAAVENIQSIIDKKEIRAPFDGAAGIRTVNPGQMVNVGHALVSLQALDQVFVDFALPQQQLAEVKADLAVKVTTDAMPGREFDGELTAVNSSVDPVTRNVALQATVENADHALRPGMFGRVKVFLPQSNPTLFIPATAVSYAPYGNSVFLIEKKRDDKTGQESLILRQQFIRTGETRGDFVAVTEGLKEGDSVVSIGVFKLRNGMDVVVDNTLQPKAELNPKPADA